MRTMKILCAALILLGLTAPGSPAAWMQFAGGPTVSNGTWPGGSAYSGTAVATASNFVNGNLSTPFIGIGPNSVPNLSPDYFATGLVPNAGPSVSAIATPYNDAGDMYHVVIDFSGTSSSAGTGFLPANSTFAIIDLDISEVYLRVKATDPASNPITSPWIGGPNAWFDMNLPMIPQGSLGAPPTLVGPASGVYDMLGINWNFDVGMWLFTTTQAVRTIEFDMARNTGNNQIGGGGAGWAFYTSPIPEPTGLTLACAGLALVGSFSPRRRG